MTTTDRLYLVKTMEGAPSWGEEDLSALDPNKPPSTLFNISRSQKEIGQTHTGMFVVHKDAHVRAHRAGVSDRPQDYSPFSLGKGDMVVAQRFVGSRFVGFSGAYITGIKTGVFELTTVGVKGTRHEGAIPKFQPLMGKTGPVRVTSKSSIRFGRYSEPKGLDYRLDPKLSPVTLDSYGQESAQKVLSFGKSNMSHCYLLECIFVGHKNHPSTQTVQINRNRKKTKYPKNYTMCVHLDGLLVPAVSYVIANR